MGVLKKSNTLENLVRSWIVVKKKSVIRIYLDY